MRDSENNAKSKEKLLDFLIDLNGMVEEEGVTQHFIEEYCGTKGYLDHVYIRELLNIVCSLNTFIAIVKEVGMYKVYGKVSDTPEEDKFNEISLSEFQKHYRFGRFVSPRTYIGVIYRKTGCEITRQRVMEYTLGSK